MSVTIITSGGITIIDLTVAQPIPDVLTLRTLLRGWAEDGVTFQRVAAVNNSNGLMTSGDIEWPDGATGTYTVDAIDTGTGNANAWHATYRNQQGVSFRITQPLMTRDSSGAISVQPDITID